jgi:hypothetical protein
MILAQVSRWKTTRANAVATWSPTSRARKRDSVADCAATTSVQPRSWGRIIEWPRLETEEELGDALEQPEHDRLEGGQHGASLPDRVQIGDSPVPLGEPGRPALTARAVPPRR